MDARDLPRSLTQSWTSARDRVADFLTPSLRLGVTGLARSGKTVFITALIRNLTQGGRLPFFTPYAEGRLLSADLEPQPDDNVPRFDYEAHVAALSREPPEWPESTRRVSELRISLSFVSEHPLRRALGVRRLNLDIVDYPGEWLLDLGMLGESYASWSREAMERARTAKGKAAAEWLAFGAGLAASAPEN